MAQKNDNNNNNYNNNNACRRADAAYSESSANTLTQCYQRLKNSNKCKYCREQQ